VRFMKSRFRASKVPSVWGVRFPLRSNCLQTDVSETNVSASTGKSACKCDGCERFTGISHESIPSLRVFRRKHYPRRLSVLLRVSGITILSVCSWKRFSQLAYVPWRR
jgi:hypothetical protein